MLMVFPKYFLKKIQKKGVKISINFSSTNPMLCPIFSIPACLKDAQSSGRTFSDLRLFLSPTRVARFLLRPWKEPLLPAAAWTQQLQPSDQRAAARERTRETETQDAGRGWKAEKGEEGNVFFFCPFSHVIVFLAHICSDPKAAVSQIQSSRTAVLHVLDDSLLFFVKTCDVCKINIF